MYKLHTKIREKMTCKGLCIRYKTYGRYAAGNKCCYQCNLFIQWDGLFCPCCGYRLRTRPRHSKSRTKLRELKQKQEVKKLKLASLK